MNTATKLNEEKCRAGTHNYTPTNSKTENGVYTVYQMTCTKCEHVVIPNQKP